MTREKEMWMSILDIITRWDGYESKRILEAWNLSVATLKSYEVHKYSTYEEYAFHVKPRLATVGQMIAFNVLSSHGLKYPIHTARGL